MNVGLIAMARTILLHPIDFFHDLQREGRARLAHAFILIGLAIVVRLLSLSWIGMLYETKGAHEISVVSESLSILLLWLSWTVANWGVSSITDGEGKFKEIVVGSAYSLVPYILLMLPLALVTNVLSLQEMSLYSMLHTAILLWVAALVVASVKILHDFEPGKLLLILFLTLCGMLIVWFVSALMIGLVSQAGSFVLDILKELQYRI